jgi:hypothetical protein
MADPNTLSVAAFTALGTIVGYLGTEVGSSSAFDRLLWPSRYYNTSNVRSIIGFICVMTMGGPIHKAAVGALDKLVLSGLWRGYCQGDMLGTIFYKDTGYRYVVREHTGSRTEAKHARNGFWITVLRLIRWRSELDAVNYRNDSAVGSDEQSQGEGLQQHQVRAQRPVFVLKLSRVNSRPFRSNGIPVVNEDHDTVAFRHLGGILASEMVTLAFGVVNAAVWKTLFCLWYLVPLLLKLIAFICHVRRGSIELPPLPPAQTNKIEGQSPSSSNSQWLLCEVTNFSHGFCLIEGPSELVLQFFRHYGHPVRHRRGLLGDRVREVISMCTVVAFILVYPSSLLSFVFAPVAIQWLWLGYQIYAIVAMHLYRFCDGDNIGTTQESVASALSDRKCVYFVDGAGNRILAQLESAIVFSVAEGRAVIEDRVREIQKRHVG